MILFLYHTASKGTSLRFFFFFSFLNYCKIQKLHHDVVVKIIHFLFAWLLSNKSITRHKKSFSPLIFITHVYQGYHSKLAIKVTLLGRIF